MSHFKIKFMFNTASSSLSNPFVWIMIGVIVFLLIVIKSLTAVLLNAARNSREAEKPVAESELMRKIGLPVESTDMAKIGLPAGTGRVVKSGLPVAGGAAVVAGPLVNGVSDTAFYFMIAVIGVEVLVIFYLIYNINTLLKKEAAAVAVVSKGVSGTRPAFSFGKWWTKVNKFKPVEEEAVLDLGHDYDGIRELDNKLPPWWLYGFYCTMIFSVIYLWRYHVSHTAPLQEEEYQIAVQQAAIQKEAYLKNAANSVDENTVKLLTGAADLEAGKAVFQTTCFACHGKGGEGGVGPNLTDAYWLHGGSIEEVFKTIKYGWPDKGMKSWKDDYSPVQIAQVSSYVESLAGTNPANAKPPQGALVK